MPSSTRQGEVFVQRSRRLLRFDADPKMTHEESVYIVVILAWPFRKIRIGVRKLGAQFHERNEFGPNLNQAAIANESIVVHMINREMRGEQPR